MKKADLLLALLLAACLLLTGCSLALPEQAGAQSSDDTLIGAFVTREPLETMDRVLALQPEALFSGAPAQAEEKLWAEFDPETRDYSFPQRKGFLLYCMEQTDDDGSYTKVCSDPVFSDGGNHIRYINDDLSYSLDAKLFYAEGGGVQSWYVNPVYQASDGVYVLPGSGVSADGGSMTQTLSQTRSETTSENGRSASRQRSCEIQITIEASAQPEQVVILWMDAEHGVLGRKVFLPGQLPETLSCGDAEFLLVEERAADGSARRAIYDAQDEQLFALSPLPDGMLTRQYAQLLWPAQETG